MMPRRWSSNTRAWAYRFLVLRDGEKCQVCDYQLPDLNISRNGNIKEIETLDIDHIDCDIHNGDPDNLRLLCRSCNVARENQSRAHRVRQLRRLTKTQLQQLYNPSDLERERERENPITRIVKEAVGYQYGSREQAANGLFEIPYRTWVITTIQKLGFISKLEAINAGAEVVGCNPTTATKYLAKLTSMTGALEETRDMLNTTVIVFKDYRNG